MFEISINCGFFDNFNLQTKPYFEDFIAHFMKMHKMAFFDDILVHFLNMHKRVYFDDLMFYFGKNTPYAVF